MVIMNNIPMETSALKETVHQLFLGSKGILAIDESPSSIAARFEAIQPGIPSHEDIRKAYRHTILSAPKLDTYLSGIIFHEETVPQEIDGVPARRYCASNGILAGVKVDTGLAEFPLFKHEKFTLGLDKLDERLRSFSEQDIRFSKWRCVFSIGTLDGHALPSDAVIKANIHQLIHFAALSQKNGIVPILEPEILTEGDHSIEESAQTLAKVLKELFSQLETYRVDISSVVLKISMVTPGKKSPERPSPETIADLTVSTLQKHVPAGLGGIVFLSGGQAPQEATARFDAIMKRSPFPWPVTYCFSRAIQDPAMQYWIRHQDTEKTVRDNDTQALLLHRLALNQIAKQGKYSPSLEARS